jgi:16S rRNA A1518/A1519 N6-dimethyltransferase RsmA/KsgA/DIM1 with predicted DNA glycosylase/AP lyase activity
MLELSNVHDDDVVFDLGCGDGRILFTAVNEFDAKRAVGYELQRKLYDQVIQDIHTQQLEERIVVFNEDLLTANIAEATIITLYLTTLGNKKLQAKLLAETKPDLRIVSHNFPFSEWEYTRKETIEWHSIYIYTMPPTVHKKQKPRSLFARFQNPFSRK